MNRRRFVRYSAILGAGALLPLPAAAQAPFGAVHELSGQVLLNGRPMTRNSVIQPGQTVTTGGDGRVWFTVAGDAFFLRPGSELRLSPSVRESVVEALRLVTGALGATFRRGAQRSVIAQTVTIGIRGTGIYVETTDNSTYACTCFGATELDTNLDNASVRAQHHAARWVHRDRRIIEAAMENHTDEEMSRLERLAGRPYPF
ncbi:MAG TPA: hypothetical protein VHG88_13565 [Burkholderiales bacterium]|nr:hypothetical protein [Burkholderiales bacterium]